MYAWITLWDVAAHELWWHETLLFGNRCDFSYINPFDHVSISSFSESPPTLLTLQNDTDTHTTFVIIDMFGWFIAALAGLLLSHVKSVQVQLHHWIFWTSWLLPLGGLVLFFVWLDGADNAFTCDGCFWALIGHLIIGTGTGLQVCFSVPYIMGSTRTARHDGVHTLLGMVGPMIVVGEGLALALAKILTDRDWLIMTAIIPTYAPLVIWIFWKPIEEYGRPNPRAVVIVNRPRGSRSGSCRSLLLRGLLWTTVDIAGQVFRLTFHKYLEKIGEEGSLAGYYAIRGDLCAFGGCVFFIIINWILLLCGASEERQHQVAFVKLFLFGLANVGCLGYIVALDANPSTTTTHADIGRPCVIYRAMAAMNYEMSFEFLPALMLDEREYLQGWCATMLIRLLLQSAILISIAALVDAVPLWVVILIQCVLHVFFVVSAWRLHSNIRHEHEAVRNHNNAGEQPNQNADPVQNQDANYIAGSREYYQGRAGYFFGMDGVRHR